MWAHPASFRVQVAEATSGSSTGWKQFFKQTRCICGYKPLGANFGLYSGSCSIPKRGWEIRPVSYCRYFPSPLIVWFLTVMDIPLRYGSITCSLQKGPVYYPGMLSSIAPFTIAFSVFNIEKDGLLATKDVVFIDLQTILSMAVKFVR